MMFGFYGILMSVVWVPIVIALIALGVVLVRRSVAAPEWMRRGASCGGCGYELSSMGDGRCPECGGALVKVGVTTPTMAMRLRGSGYLLVMGWTIIVVMACVPVMGAISWMSMNVQMSWMNQVGAFTPSNKQQGVMTGSIEPGMQIDDRGNFRREGSAYSISFHVSVETDETGQAESGSIEMNFLKIETPYELSIDLVDLSWKLADESGSPVLTGTAFDDVAAAQVYEKVGLNEQSDRSEESKFLATAIRDLKQAPESFGSGLGSPFGSEPLQISPRNSSWGPVGGFGGGGYTGPTTSYWDYAGIGVYVLGAMVYLVGLIVLIRKRRRLLQSPAIG